MWLRNESTVAFIKELAKKEQTAKSQIVKTQRGPSIGIVEVPRISKLIILNVYRGIVEIQSARERGSHRLDVLVFAAALSHYSPL
jgi:hypothetical protein